MQANIPADLFETLFESEYRGVVSAARRIVGLSAAEDIAQEVFSALYRAGPSELGHARNWLYRATLHRAISALRADRRREAREGSMSAVVSRSEDPSAEVERGELLGAVQTALRRIHARYAQVLALRHSGLSYKEIAAIMDVKVNQVGTLLVRAEAAFKKEYSRVSSVK